MRRVLHQRQQRLIAFRIDGRASDVHVIEDAADGVCDELRVCCLLVMLFT